jgi:hypothetical protein
MLSFESIEGGKIIQISGDVPGLKRLVEKITELIRTGGHTHLYGGKDLTMVTPFGDPATGEVIIDLEDKAQP